MRLPGTPILTKMTKTKPNSQGNRHKNGGSIRAKAVERLDFATATISVQLAFAYTFFLSGFNCTSLRIFECKQKLEKI
jgi:hypothetical protein